MKNKSFLLTILTIVALITIFSFTNKVKSTGGILTMRATEVDKGLMDNSITIVYEDGHSENIKLKKIRGYDLSENLIIINENLNKIKSKGYRLISTTSGLVGDDMLNYIMTTYTFEKE